MLWLKGRAEGMLTIDVSSVPGKIREKSYISDSLFSVHRLRPSHVHLRKAALTYMARFLKQRRRVLEVAGLA